MALDVRTAAARTMTVGFHGKTISPELGALLDRGVGGVIFFARNVGDPAEVAALGAAIKRRAGRPLVLSVDQEGGDVARLRHGFTPVPSMRTLGRVDDAELTFGVGRLLGRELRAVGFDLDYAPVLDVDTNPQNPVIGARSFSPSPELVAWHGMALAQGLMSAGVAACGKHFPGHGDTEQDSHLALPRVAHDQQRLDEVELAPFRAAVKAELPALMSAHVLYPALDAEWPATMSSRLLTDLLRNRMGYSGLVVSDDLEMAAMAEHFSLKESVTRALAAGVDVFLCCHDPAKMHAAIDAVAEAIVSGRVPPYRLERAVERVETFAARWAAPPLERFEQEVIACPEHLALVERIRARAES